MEGEQPYIGDLLPMVINHLLTRMIFQVDATVGFQDVVIGSSKSFAPYVEMFDTHAPKPSKQPAKMPNIFLIV